MEPAPHSGHLKFGRLTCCVMMSKMWQYANFTISVRKGACGNGAILGPRRCGPRKYRNFQTVWSLHNFDCANFQPFYFNIFFLPKMTSRYLQSFFFNRKDFFEANLCPFCGFNPFWVTKIRRSHIYGTCASMDLNLAGFCCYNDV